MAIAIFHWSKKTFIVNAVTKFHISIVFILMKYSKIYEEGKLVVV